jgi:hypothetical protein
VDRVEPPDDAELRGLVTAVGGIGRKLPVPPAVDAGLMCGDASSAALDGGSAWTSRNLQAATPSPSPHPFFWPPWDPLVRCCDSIHVIKINLMDVADASD